LEKIAALLELDEILVVTVVYEHQARVHSYKLLSEAFGLNHNI
jgi:hypothetical protein